MIKKIIGTLFAVAVISLIVFTALGAGSYESMLPEGTFSFMQRGEAQQSAAVEEVAEESADDIVAEEQDSLAEEQTEEQSEELTTESADEQ
ncbi:MAG: hypothetical protein IKU22_03740 [Alistipes sp.]|nr:hypothetical protein [Alistipes sp.]